MRSFTLFGTVAAIAMAFAGSAQAGECTSGECGTPDQSGGGCGCGCGCSILVAMTDRGDTYQFADDFDADGIEDEFDNCPFAGNFEQLDGDGDQVGDACDLCPSMSDPMQANVDGDAKGDACDEDMDGDGFLNAADTCPKVPNPAQVNTDGDEWGDVCDDDDDNDGVLDIDDGCRLQAGTVASAACENDEDGDGIPGNIDNCPAVANDQVDTNGNGLGDACDIDLDGDGVPNYLDNCRGLANPSQLDLDGDGLGDNGNFGGGPESCDPNECYQVPFASDCLAVNGAFRVALFPAGLPDTGKFEVGDDIVLVMITNRLHANHAWTARFDELPSDSETAPKNAKGSAGTLDRGPQVASCLVPNDNGSCAELNSIRFKADAPGHYVIKVNVNLDPETDPLGLGPATATATVGIDVAGEKASGCAATPAVGSAFAALVGLLGLVRRRRG